MKNSWHGFECKEVLFEGQNAVIVFSGPERSIGKISLKTEIVEFILKHCNEGE